MLKGRATRGKILPRRALYFADRIGCRLLNIFGVYDNITVYLCVKVFLNKRSTSVTRMVESVLL